MTGCSDGLDMGGGWEGEGGAKDASCRFLAFETGWEVVLLPPNGSPGRALGFLVVGRQLKSI